MKTWVAPDQVGQFKMPQLMGAIWMEFLRVLVILVTSVTPPPFSAVFANESPGAIFSRGFILVYPMIGLGISYHAFQIELSAMLGSAFLYSIKLSDKDEISIVLQ